MPFFPSDEWMKAFARGLNQNKEFAGYAKTCKGDFHFVILPDTARDQPIDLYIDLWRGKCRAAGLVGNALAKKPTWTLSAPLSVWRKIIDGKLHPVAAIAREKIMVQGNAVKLLGNVKAIQEALDSALRVPVTFPE